jgi:shikimate dehydrogenase
MNFSPNSRPEPYLAGVMGWPVAHSKSPKLHGFWMQECNLDGAYVRLPVEPHGLPNALKGLAGLGFRGVNVTVPHKEAVIRHLDEVDPLAKRIGAVNTIVVNPNGHLTGYNTDAEGFWTNLVLNHPDILLADSKKALVLGAGGAARAVVGALLGNGFKSIRLANRSRERADALVRDFGDERIHVVRWDERQAVTADICLLVNTTTLGMKGQPVLDFNVGVLPKDCVVCDLVYAPVHTPLLLNARMEGLPTVDGLGMLIHQAVPAFTKFFDRPPPLDKDAMARLRLFLMKP